MLSIGHRLYLRRLIHTSYYNCAVQAPTTSKAQELPSTVFLRKNVRTPQQKDRLAQLATELQMFREFFGTNDFSGLNDSDWQLLFDIKHSDDRADYLLSLRKGEDDETSTNEVKRKISEINQERYDNGEMVYARYFHNLIELYGQDFRAMIDKVYGARYLSKDKFDELVNLIVDCRYMSQFTARTQKNYLGDFQSLHDGNWFSKHPFNVIFANLRPDKQCSELMKSHLHFLYGPKRLQNQTHSLNDANSAFLCTPFSPTVSNKHLSDHADIHDEDTTLYVSWKALRFLPDDPPQNLKNIIICASDDRQPVNSSLTAATSDRIVPYRIPFEKYASFNGQPNIKISLPLAKVAGILREWVNGYGWRTAINNNMAPNQPLSKDESANKNQRLEIEKCFKMAMRDFQIVYRQDKLAEREKLKTSVPRVTPQHGRVEERPRFHRYSREERNARRLAEVTHNRQENITAAL